jgi:hypothetical protein
MQPLEQTQLGGGGRNSFLKGEFGFGSHSTSTGRSKMTASSPRVAL